MRFAKIISVVPKCKLLAEVGCDHARLTETALANGLTESAIVSDISEKCLAKARRTLRNYTDVTYIAGDGVVTDGRQPDCIMICGMGGHTIADILSRYNGNATLVLSPQSHAEIVRRKLYEMGYALSVDECFEDGGKFYDLLRAEKGRAVPDETQINYGIFYKVENPALKKRLNRMLLNLYGDKNKNSARISEIEEVLKWQL